MSTSNQRQSVITKRKPNYQDSSTPPPKALKKAQPSLDLTFSKKKIVADQEIDITDEYWTKYFFKFQNQHLF